MLKKTPKPLSELISATDSPLGQLAEEARSRLELTDHIRKGLPAELASQMTSCNLRSDGTLVVIASGPEWAARIRFESSLILSLSRERNPKTTQVKVRVGHPNN